MTEIELQHSAEARRKRNLYAVLAGFVAAVMLIGTFLWGTQAARRFDVASSNAQTLAVQIGQACESGSLVVSGRDVCPDLQDKADKIAADPSDPVPGPPGKDGKPGIDGKDGADGKDSTIPGPSGKDGASGGDSTVPGPAGKDSVVPGPPGKDGSDGSPGKDGADSTVPGPAGRDGVDGKDGVNGTNGTDGKSPESFTFTDKTGTTYTCTPNPPGSATYTCAADGGLIP
jgi:hypothetical protein